jgi:hypothetical protein
MLMTTMAMIAPRPGPAFPSEITPTIPLIK